MATKKNTAKAKPATNPSPDPAKIGPPARYRLTAPYWTKGGATWPKGFEVVASPEEIAERGIKAELVDHDG